VESIDLIAQRHSASVHTGLRGANWKMAGPASWSSTLAMISGCETGRRRRLPSTVAASSSSDRDRLCRLQIK